MSRLESNSEPSMEEILASIRKIIAEDSSGLRSPPTPRTGAPYSPAPRSTTPAPTPSLAPQRGFMSREAFLKSSQPVEPEPRQAYVPLNSPRSPGNDSGSASASSGLRPRDDASARNDEADEASAGNDSFRAREELRSSEPVQSKERAQQVGTKEESRSLKSDKAASQRNGAVPADDTETVETVEVVALKEALSVLEDRAPPRDQVEVKPNLGSDTARIEAQLSELLSEDLNALRQGRPDSGDGGAGKSGSPAPKSETSQIDKPVTAKPAIDSNDPFAFDLGPSPFAAKPEPLRPAGNDSVSEPAATSSPATPPRAPGSAPFETSRTATGPSFAETNIPANGAAFANPSGRQAPVVPPANVAPREVDTPTDAQAARSRESFAVPSVSATLGPSRKLEPLSNAFGPPPAPPPSAMESFSPAAEPAFEPPRLSYPAPPWDSHRGAEPAMPPASIGRGKADEPVVRGGLPATTSDSSLDRPMEDAVADLLRPLLKTWLAENMPKIVERALRREMTERLLPGQKSSQD